MDFSQLQNNQAVGLAIALLLGLLIGAQRGWVDRDRAAGQRVAGVRTHALIGLLGGICGLLSGHFSELVLGFAFLSLTVIVTVAYVNSQKSKPDMSITSLIGILITFALGALAVLGQPIIAASAAVITTFILDNKAEIHGALKKLEENELDAALKLLLISVVMLPLLPNQGYGPWKAINPYETWWMVVLIASISFVGYFAIKIGGTEKGILFTSLFAGLSSSTALTLHFSKVSRDNPALSPLLAAGILAACGTMFPRILFVCAIINRDLIDQLLIPVTVMTLLTYVPAILIWRLNRTEVINQPQLNQNPLELSAALLFGVVLLVIMLLSHVLQDWLGEAGVYLLAAVSGITDVDAITLTLGRQSTDSLALQVATLGIIIAAAVNSCVKSGMAASIGHASLGKRVFIPLVSAVSGGLLSAWIFN